MKPLTKSQAEAIRDNSVLWRYHLAASSWRSSLNDSIMNNAKREELDAIFVIAASSIELYLRGKTKEALVIARKAASLEKKFISKIKPQWLRELYHSYWADMRDAMISATENSE